MNKKLIVILGIVVAVALIVIAAMWGMNRGQVEQAPETQVVEQQAPLPPPPEARPPRPPKADGAVRPPKAPRPPKPEGEMEAPEAPQPPPNPQDFLNALINGDGKPVEPVNKDEALQGAREFLENYRAMSDEDKMGARIFVGMLKGVLDNMTAEAPKMVAEMTEERKMELLSVYEESKQALIDVEEELNAEMDDEEQQAFGGILESMKSVNDGFYNAIMDSQK